MNLREKTAVVTLLSLLLVYGGYVVWWWMAPRSLQEIAAGLAVTVLIETVLAGALAAVVAALHGREPADERDRIVADRSLRAPYYLLLGGVVCSLVLVWSGAASVWLIHAMTLSIVLAEVIRYTTQLLFYRSVHRA